MLIMIHGPRTKDQAGVRKKAYSMLKDCAWLTKLSQSKQTNRNRGLLSDCRRAITTGTQPKHTARRYDTIWCLAPTQRPEMNVVHDLRDGLKIINKK